MIFSTSGGTGIEEVARRAPESVARTSTDPLRGFHFTDANALVQTLQLPENEVAPIAQTLERLYTVFWQHDARSAEINPLVVTTQGQVVALDCRISIDAASTGRQPALEIAGPRESDTPPTLLDQIAWTIEANDYRGVSFYAQFPTDPVVGGGIGFHAIGGGGALLAADTLIRNGLKLANYAESSGNPPASKVYRLAKVILAQRGLEGYCLLGAVIASQDQWHHAHGLVKAFREELTDRPGFPVVILLAGNKEQEALSILRESLADLPIQLELFGRDYIHRLDLLAARMKDLVDHRRVPANA